MVSLMRHHPRVLAELVASLRRQRGLTRDQLAVRAGVHHNSIGRLERGEVVAHSTTLRAIELALGLEREELGVMSRDEIAQHDAASAPPKLPPPPAPSWRGRGRPRRSELAR